MSAIERMREWPPISSRVAAAADRTQPTAATPVPVPEQQQKPQAAANSTSGGSKQKQKQKEKKKRKRSFDSMLSIDSELDEFDTQAARIKPESIDNLVKLTKFNKRELKLMYRGFKQLCPSGVVKEDKFKLIYAQFFPRGAETNGYARYVFNSFDVQHKQEITFTDFVIGLSVLTRGTIDEQLRWIFTLYDINGDGVITRDELNRIVNSIHDLMGKLALTPGQAALLQEQQQLQSSGSQSTNRSANSNQQSSQQQHQHQQSSLSSLTLQTQTTTAPNNSNGQHKEFLLQPTRSSEAQLESLFKKFDLNNDGMITLDEFIEACREDENIIRSISVFNTVL